MNFSRKKEIVRLDDNKNFKDISISINSKYPDEPLKQIEAWEKQPYEYRVMGISSVVQNFLAHNLNESIELKSNQVEFLYRAFMDLSRHLQEDLPKGVYDYNYSNLKDVSEYIIKEISD